MFPFILAAAMASTNLTMADPAKEQPKSDPAPATSPAPASPSKPDSNMPKDSSAQPAKETSQATKTDAYVLGFKMKDIDGKEVDLAQYKGQVILIVNVASKCGYTPQYAALEKLYKDKKAKGFVILGFPANNFGEQEPGTDAEIKTFCTSKYNVTFPMFSKISVRGDDQHPLYQKLASQPKPIGGDGIPEWNFTKFLVDKKGNVVERFTSKVKPDDPTLVRRIDEQLAK
jgi:glutathione peroxidase